MSIAMCDHCLRNFEYENPGFHEMYHYCDREDCEEVGSRRFLGAPQLGDGPEYFEVPCPDCFYDAESELWSYCSKHCMKMKDFWLLLERLRERLQDDTIIMDFVNGGVRIGHAPCRIGVAGPSGMPAASEFVKC